MKPRSGAGGGPYVTLADLSAWTWQNQGTATLTQSTSLNTGGVVLTVPGSAVDSIRHIVRPVPSLSYQLTVRFVYDGSNSNYKWMCVGWKEAPGAAAKLHLVSFDRRSAFRHYILQCANETTVAVASTFADYNQPYSSLRVKEAGGSVYFYTSESGSAWDLRLSVAKAAGYLGANGYNYLVIGANESNTAEGFPASIIEYKLENV